MLFFLPNFREDIAHGFCEHVHELVEEWFVKSERAAITNRAAQNATQNIIAVRVARLNPIRNRKAQCADVIGDHSERNVYLELIFFSVMGSATVPVALLGVPPSSIRRP